MEALTAMKANKNYLIGADVVLETDCLPLLRTVVNCSTPDITMLRWIAYIRSLNLILVYISGKKVFVADMLSRARYICEEDMETHEIGEDEEGYVQATDGGSTSEQDEAFREDLYRDKLKNIVI